MKSMLFSAVLAATASFSVQATSPCQPCACDPSARQTVIHDSYGGIVSVTSYIPPVRASEYQLDFQRADMDQDGLINRREVASAFGYSPAAKNLMLEFHVVDTNQDGWLTEYELREWLAY